MTWLTTHYGLIATILLTVAEIGNLVFPPSTGFGGYLSSVVKFFKGAGVKDVSGQ